MLDEVQAALEGGFVAKEPPMMFLAARFSEANNRIQPMEVDFDEEAILGRSHYACGGDEWQRQLRRLYPLACRWGSIHVLLYVAWLLDTGRKPELFARDMRLAQRFLAQARAAGGALEAPLFPELSFMEDSEYDAYTITDELEFYEENYGRPAGGGTLDPTQTGTSGMTSSRSSTTCRRHGCGPSPSVRTSRPGVPRRGCWCARRYPKRGSVVRRPCLRGASSHLWRV
jgi:hypothetical protein